MRNKIASITRGYGFSFLPAVGVMVVCLTIVACGSSGNGSFPQSISHEKGFLASADRICYKANSEKDAIPAAALIKHKKSTIRELKAIEERRLADLAKLRAPIKALSDWKEYLALYRDQVNNYILMLNIDMNREWKRWRKASARERLLIKRGNEIADRIGLNWCAGFSISAEGWQG